MKPLHRILDTARQNPRRIILPEGDCPLVVEAARQIAEDGIADVILMNAPQIPGVVSLAPAEAPDLPILADTWMQMRAGRGMDRQQALDDMKDPVKQAAMRVRLGLADGTVGGAVKTTAEIVRAALQIIGPAPDTSVVSSCFLLLSCDAHMSFKGGMIFADCGLVIEPDARQLATIASSAANSCRQLLNEEPRVAMLSFSTAGSAEHHSLEKIREAVALLRVENPDLEVDGEMQFDAAFDDAIRAKKAPHSRLSSRPNVFIFPDLASGNIGYKIAQRLGGLTSIGPILQGLAKPANDLSRGCSVEDIIAAAAVTSVQASATHLQTSTKGILK